MNPVIIRVVVYIFLTVIAGLTGYYQGKGQREIQIIEKVGETRTEWRNRIVTVTRVVRPDGTTEESTSTRDEERESSSRSSSRDNQSRPVLSNYSLGLSYWASYSSPIQDLSTADLRRIELHLGRRIVGEVWVEIGVREESFSLGVSTKF